MQMHVLDTRHRRLAQRARCDVVMTLVNNAAAFQAGAVARAGAGAARQPAALCSYLCWPLGDDKSCHTAPPAAAVETCEECLGHRWHSANGASATVCISAPGPATENGNERDRHSQQDKDTVLTALRRNQPSVTSLTRRPALPLAATPVDAVAVSSHNQPPSPTLMPRIFYHLAMPASVPHGRPWPAHIDRHATI
jgi:hypothetical protein